MVLFFAEDSQHPFIKRAMRDARKIRKELREALAAKISAPDSQTGPSRLFEGRRFTAGRSE